MKCVDTFKSREKASEARRQLKERGIDAKILVEGLDGRFAALVAFEDVALVVRDEHYQEAAAILGGFRRAS